MISGYSVYYLNSAAGPLNMGYGARGCKEYPIFWTDMKWFYLGAYPRLVLGEVNIEYDNDPTPTGIGAFAH